MKNYIDIMELMLLNNKNKKIVKLYLDFILKNENFIIKLKVNLNDELLKYQKIFTIDELKKFGFGFKNKSEKTNFIDFLIYLSKDNNNYNEIFTKANKLCNEIYYFNFPIEFYNKELFFYKIYISLIIVINDNNKREDWLKRDYILNKSKIAKKIIDNNILNNDKIIINKDKMNILIILILFEKLDKQGESIYFNRLLQTEKATFKKLKKYIEVNNIATISNNTININGNVMLEKIRGDIDNNIIVNINDVCLKILNDKE